MSKKTLAVAVALTMVPMFSVAGSFQIVGGQNLEPSHGGAVASSSPANAESSPVLQGYHGLQVGGWRIQGAPAAISGALNGISGNSEETNPKVLAEMLIAMTRQSGLVGYTASIDAASHTITLLKSTVDARGDLSGYLGHTNTVKGIEDSEPLMAQAAAAEGGTASLNIGQPEHGVVPVSATVKNPGVRWSVGALLSSFGPRYAGSDVVSEYGTVRGDGYVGDLALTQGLPSWTPKQSFGGDYFGVSGGISHPTPYGVFGITGQYARFKEGGVSRDLGITGNTGLVGLTYAYPINPDWQVRSGLYYGFQHETLGLVGFHSSQDFMAAKVGLAGVVPTGYRGGSISLKGNLWDGFGGHTTGILLGRPSSNAWQMGNFNADLFQPLPYRMAVQAEVGGQYATSNLPQQEYFTLGGAWRGDSYYTGQAATPSGIYGGIRLYAPDIKYKMSGQEYSARPFVGVNGSEGQPLFGEHLEAASVDMGSKFQISRYVSGEVGYALSIDNQGPHHPRGRLFFEVTGNY